MTLIKGERAAFPRYFPAILTNMSSPKRPKPPPEPPVRVINPAWRGDMLCLAAGLVGAIGVVLYGYYSQKWRKARWEKGLVDVDYFEHQIVKDDEEE